MENGKLLMNIGDCLYKSSKFLFICLTIGIVGLFLTITSSGEYAIKYLSFSGHFSFVNMIVLFMYMLIALGSLCIPFYFGGLILIGLGQIAINTAPEEERKTYFSSKNGVVSNITPPDGAARTTKSFVSPMLSKIIQNAINIDNDAAILHYLQDSIKRLTKDKEKQIIDYILKVPNGELRPTLLKVYNEITEPVPKPTVSQEPEQ